MWLFRHRLGPRRLYDISNGPCPIIMAGGINGVSIDQYTICFTPEDVRAAYAAHGAGWSDPPGDDLMARNKNKFRAEDALFSGEELGQMGYDPNSPFPPREWPEYDETLEIDRCCPRCGYRWSSGGEDSDVPTEQ